MAGIISIGAELRGAEAARQLQALIDRMDDRRPFFAAIGERLLRSAALNFDRQSGPDGAPWQPLRPSTIRARQRAGQLPLTILRSNSKGKIGSPLAGSINYEATDDEVRIGSPVEYAAIHQLGGAIRRAARKGRTYRVQAEDGTIGRRFAKKKTANLVTEVSIPAYVITIPARPYLGVSAADEEGILEDAEDWLMR